MVHKPSGWHWFLDVPLRDMTRWQKFNIFCGVMAVAFYIGVIGYWIGLVKVATGEIPLLMATTTQPPEKIVDALLGFEYWDASRTVHLDVPVGMRAWHNGEQIFVGKYVKSAFTYDSESQRVTLRYTHGWPCLTPTHWSGTVFAGCGPEARIRRMDNTTFMCHINVWIDLPELCPAAAAPGVTSFVKDDHGCTGKKWWYCVFFPSLET